MNKGKRRGAALLAAVLAVSCAAGGKALAAGDKSDPLVTLSYLEETFLPTILKQAEQAADSKKTELSAQFDKKLAEYAQSGTAETDSATYAVVTLSKGQQLKLAVGCEVMLRVGTATVSANTEPALVDVTTGGNLSSGKGLEKNHLYLATIADRTVKAGGDTVKLLVRGGYTLG